MTGVSLYAYVMGKLSKVISENSIITNQLNDKITTWIEYAKELN